MPQRQSAKYLALSLILAVSCIPTEDETKLAGLINLHTTETVTAEEVQERLMEESDELTLGRITLGKAHIILIPITKDYSKSKEILARAKQIRLRTGREFLEVVQDLADDHSQDDVLSETLTGLISHLRAMNETSEYQGKFFDDGKITAAETQEMCGGLAGWKAEYEAAKLFTTEHSEALKVLEEGSPGKPLAELVLLQRKALNLITEHCAQPQ